MDQLAAAKPSPSLVCSQHCSRKSPGPWCSEGLQGDPEEGHIREAGGRERRMGTSMTVVEEGGPGTGRIHKDTVTLLVLAVGLTCGVLGSVIAMSRSWTR